MVNCDVFLRENRKTVCITVGKNAEVIVKAPYFLSENKINEIISKKQEWINKHVRKYKLANQQYKDIAELNSILYFNEAFNVLETSVKKPILQNGVLYIKNCSSITIKQKEIKNWFIQTAQNVLHTRLQYFAELMDLDFSVFKLTNSKTKWGSCSSKKEIQLNWRLIMLDSALQDYVIVHELCHLMEMNHSSAFYKCIESILPDYKIRRKAIKDSTFILQLYR